MTSKGWRNKLRAGALVTIGMAASNAGAAVISEVLYDVTGSDAGQVFVELYGTPGTVLDGWSLEGINGTNGGVYRTVLLTGVIPADGVFVIGDDDGTGSSLVGNADLVADVDFQNGPDSIVLRDGSGIRDALGYGDFTSAVFAGEGNPSPGVPVNWSLARPDAAVDTDNNAVDFMGLEIPTPGIVPASPVPVPAAAWLFASGLFGLVGVSRRNT